MPYYFDDFCLDPGRRELRRDGSPVALEPKVFDLIACLVERRDQVVTREDLISMVWNGRIVSESALSTCINAARAAVGDNGDAQRLIKTHPRKGFRFIGAVRDDATQYSSIAIKAAGTPMPPSDRPSIAVLPFQNMSSDPEQEYFVDGVVTDIIAALARIKWLFVISRNSSFVYKHREADVKQIGLELGVRYALEGSIRKAGSRVRIVAQLIDAETGTHIWVERYDRELDDIFALQDDISEQVVGAIEPNLRHAEVSRVRRRRPESLEAYDLVLRAQPFAYSHLADDAAVAIPLLNKALSLEPDYAAAHAPLALCHHSRFSRAGLNEIDRTLAIQHAHAAIAHGSDDAAALGVAGFVIALDAHDRTTALNAFDRAIALSNSNFFALCSSALALSWMGTTDIAIDRARRALRLSPFDSLNYLSYNALAISFLHTGQYPEAHDVAIRSVQLNPRFSVSRAFLVAALFRLGRVDEAADEARRLLKTDSGFSVRRFSVTVDIEPAVFTPLAEAWEQAGLPLD